MSSSASWRLTLPPPLFSTKLIRSHGFHGKLNSLQIHASIGEHQVNAAPTTSTNINKKKKVVVVGSGWSGLGAANHLCKQGFDVTVLEDGDDFGSSEDIGIQGFWYPYQNIFSLVDDLGIKPFTNWMKSAQYSQDGLEVEFPIYQDLPQLPSPLGSLLYTQFPRIPLLDRLASLPVMAAVIDFDNTDTSWRKYDPITARELLRQYGCSERLYRDTLRPLLQVGLYAPPEQCSAAATLAMLYYLFLAHQKNFDVVWCRGTIREKIFTPWMDFMRTEGCEFVGAKRVTGFLLDEETDRISGVVCGRETYNADAVILAVRISTLKDMIKKSAALCTRDEFLKVLNLASIDALTVKIQLDQKVKIPNACNSFSGFDDSFASTFFDLNVLHDEHKDNPSQVIQADFYNATELLPLRDEDIVGRVMSYISNFVKDFENATVVDKEIKRYLGSFTHFFPGSYKYLMRGSTSFPNLFMAGDWIINRHGSWSQEKSYVTGLEAANRVVDYLQDGSFAKIIPVEEDELHIEALRSLNRRFNEIISQSPLSSYFIQ